MNIGSLHTLYGRRAGAELQTERILLTLASLPDVHLTVFCNREAYDTLPEETATFTKIYRRPLDNQFRKAAWLEFSASQDIKDKGVEVFWIPSGSNSFPGPWRIPTVVSFLDLGEYFVKNKYDWVRTLYRKALCIPLSLRRATEFTALSQQTADDLNQLFKMRKPPHVILPGSSPRFLSLRQPDPAAVIRAETGQELERIIFYPARTDYLGKGFDLLLPAYQAWSATLDNPPPLILAGPAGMGHERLLQAIADLGLKNQVFWLNGQILSTQCIDALYQISEMVVIPSRYEGFGYPVTEAMEHGVPAICSDAGSLPEAAGDAALLFPSGDKAALLAAMKRIRLNPDLRARLLQNGQKRLKTINWQRNATQMLKVFIQARIEYV